ncbi:uncharacterized protein SPPG_03947 [Spizellomyces punctatus DAOM BR117]|uniref:GATA-type domain-containing protein n=1 Tax=Spizellomyces punctatus (strain DAOM BR117) TaxID=645134 RepID=A0A0L0HIG4_SPIPD|nr:uncharacterized protein SPPG_03947 [Spizellomyces punctatus DAOM BR117]KND00843.1 hypothetical protein SPPG_03947 [Spizellomyces punctatus DAOM BR117]|eukprot:XP_016608882.1 hypothetical protein SPPG_03947 [Spizellomyces punctatus DAOM BR117]
MESPLLSPTSSPPDSPLDSPLNSPMEGLESTHLDNMVPQPAESADGPTPLGRAPDSFPCFWTLLSYQSLRFLYLPTSLKERVSQTGMSADSLLGQSLFDFLHPADAHLIQRDFRCFMDLRTLQGSIIRCRIRHPFADRARQVDYALRLQPFSLQEALEFPKLEPTLNFLHREDDYILADIGVNAINEECVLAFFHVGRDHGGARCAESWKGEARWSANEIAELGLGLKDMLKKIEELDRTAESSRTLDAESDPAASKSRCIQVLDSEDLSLLFAYPKGRLSSILKTDIEKFVREPDLPSQTMHPDDARRFRGMLKKKRTAKPSIKKENVDFQPAEVEKLHCTSSLFYMQHRMRVLDQETAKSEHDTYIEVESVVVPYGSVLFICTQTLGPIIKCEPGQDTLEFLLDSPAKTQEWADEHKHKIELLDGAKEKAKQSSQGPLQSAAKSGHNFPGSLSGRQNAAPGEDVFVPLEQVTRRWIEDAEARRVLNPGPYDYLSGRHGRGPLEAIGRGKGWPPHDSYGSGVMPPGYYEYWYGLTSGKSGHRPTSPTQQGSATPDDPNRKTDSQPSGSDVSSTLAQAYAQWEKLGSSGTGPAHAHIPKAYYPPSEFGRMRAYGWDVPAGQVPEGHRAQLFSHAGIFPERGERRYSDDLGGRPYAAPKKEIKARVCESCLTTESPEWRRGPSGQKTLCNACGLRYSRSIAKQRTGSVGRGGGGGRAPLASPAVGGAQPDYREGFERAATTTPGCPAPGTPISAVRPLSEEWTSVGGYTKP